MLVPPGIMKVETKMINQINKFYTEHVQARKHQINKTIKEVTIIIQEILKEVELQEPRFISSLTDCNNKR